MITLTSFAATDPGTVRGHNEDAYVNAPASGLFAVADGAGGHAAGEVASGMLSEALAHVPASLGPDETLAHIRLAVLAVHASLQAEAVRRGDSMIASTLVILLIRGGHFAALWAGDSRLYLWRHGILSQVTRDHSLVQMLVDEGAISAAEAEGHPQANVITRAIGAPEDTGELDKTIGAVEAGDIFLLCSDGLNKAVQDSEIASLLVRDDPATALISAALARNARDNVTALVVRVAGDAVDPAPDREVPVDAV
jgi:protein phosphatase/serine/threonine-protein phosphatase Stp1